MGVYWDTPPHGAIKNNPREYNSWAMMHYRCLSKNGRDYSRWGGRGISICQRWTKGENGVHPFICFLEDMGAKPPKHTLDRFPNENGNYEPTNCRWATRAEQAWNKIGKPRPDLAARNHKGKGRKLSPEHRRKIGISITKSEAWANWNQNRGKRRKS